MLHHQLSAWSFTKVNSRTDMGFDIECMLRKNMKMENWLWETLLYLPIQCLIMYIIKHFPKKLFMMYVIIPCPRNMFIMCVLIPCTKETFYNLPLCPRKVFIGYAIILCNEKGFIMFFQLSFTI